LVKPVTDVVDKRFSSKSGGGKLQQSGSSMQDTVQGVSETKRSRKSSSTSASEEISPLTRSKLSIVKKKECQCASERVTNRRNVKVPKMKAQCIEVDVEPMDESEHEMSAKKPRKRMLKYLQQSRSMVLCNRARDVQNNGMIAKNRKQSMIDDNSTCRSKKHKGPPAKGLQTLKELR
jgi:hypothetical protein